MMIQVEQQHLYSYTWDEDVDMNLLLKYMSTMNNPLMLNYMLFELNMDQWNNYLQTYENMDR